MGPLTRSGEITTEVSVPEEQYATLPRSLFEKEQSIKKQVGQLDSGGFMKPRTTSYPSSIKSMSGLLNGCRFFPKFFYANSDPSEEGKRDQLSKGNVNSPSSDE